MWRLGNLLRTNVLADTNESQHRVTELRAQQLSREELEVGLREMIALVKQAEQEGWVEVESEPLFVVTLLVTRAKAWAAELDGQGLRERHKT